MASWICAYVKTHQTRHLNIFRLLRVIDTYGKLFFFFLRQGKQKTKQKHAIFQEKKKKENYIFFNDSRKPTQVLQDTKNPSRNEIGYKK